jgi:hypothetical protein
VAWNSTELEKFFLPMDVEIIKAIPLCTRRIDDFWAWNYEKNSMLSVRLVYRMLVQTKKRREDWLDERPGGSGVATEGRNWQQLWKTNVPSKLRVFLWLLAQQSPPTADVRCHRNMATQSSCVVCGEEDSGEGRKLFEVGRILKR